MRSLSRHVDDILSDNRIKSNNLTGFTEIQTKLSDSTSKIIETLNFFNINFNNKENKLLSFANGCRNIALLNKFNA